MARGKKSRSEKKVIPKIIQSYKQNEETLVAQLYFNHQNETTLDTYRENIWKSMFEQIIPKKFAIAQSVYIIDSNKGVSEVVNLAIYDETYTPYIFHYGIIKFIPIEAVAVVVRCLNSLQDSYFHKKNTSEEDVSQVEDLNKWVEKVSCLTTSQEACVRFAQKIGKRQIQHIY